jgi:putative flippase GtrA
MSHAITSSHIPSVTFRGLLRNTASRARLSRDLIAYLVFGGIAAVVNLAVGWLLYHEFAQLRLPYWSTTTVAAACGLIVNFLLNNGYFRFGERSAISQFGTFVFVAGLGVVLTGALSHALLAPFRGLLTHQIAGIHVTPEFAAHIAAVGLVVLYSFPAHRLISFNVGIRARLHQLVRRGVN